MSGNSYDLLKNDNRYDAWLLWDITEKCNLDCTYCTTKQRIKNGERKAPLNNKINITLAIDTLNNSNRTFLIGLAGSGEPFSVSNILELCSDLTKKHFLILNTNLTSSKIKIFAEKIDPARVILIVASLHIKELERLGLVEKYIENFLFCKEKGFNIVTSVVAYPPLLTESERYKEFFENKGIKLLFGPFCGEYNNKRYPDAYTKEEIKLFDYIKLFDLKDNVSQIYHQKGNTCNAGYNVGAIYFSSGDIHPCPSLPNESIGNIYKAINFNNNLMICPLDFCGCPVKVDVPYLFERALKEKER